MTQLELYDKALIEQNKMEAPTLLIEEFNYLINKAIQQYINLFYARYESNQQSSDDLRWLQRTEVLSVKTGEKLIRPGEETRYYCTIPDNYLHMLGCTVEFENTNSSNMCVNPSDKEFSLCRRLTSDQFPAIIQNAYLKPTYKNPYFFLQPNEGKIDIICGKNNGIVPKNVYIDYLKKPKEIELTWDDVQSGKTTEECEFPDAVAYEIINILMKLIFENASDPRMQTNFAINQTNGTIPSSGEKK